MTNYTIIYNDSITSKISDGAFRLYTLLQSYCYGDKNTCYPSQTTLAKQMGKSVRTIQRYLKELVQAGLIKKKRRGSISNLYTIIAKMGKAITKTIKDIGNKNNKDKNYNYYKNKKKNQFNNYKQRSYNLKDLEKKLTAWETNYS